MKIKMLSFLGLIAMGFVTVHAEQTKMNGKLKVTTLAPEEVCYTGKPYSKELGAYVFNYRNYDPKINRWTSADPTGFQDGANDRHYAPTPTRQVDAFGLNTITVTGGAAPASISGGDFSVENGPYYTVAGSAVVQRTVSQQNIDTLNTLYQGTFVAASNPPNFTVNVTEYTTTLEDGSGGLSIHLSVPAGYDFTQNITTNDPAGSNAANHPYADLHNSPGCPPDVSRTNSGNEGDLVIGAGNWYDTPGRTASDALGLSGGVSWTANLYIVQVSGSTYTVVGRLMYSFTITE